MKVKVSPIALKELVSKVGYVVSSRITQPILKNFLVEAEGSSLSFYGNDGNMMLRGTIETVVEEEGTICVDAKKMTDIVSVYAQSGYSEMMIETTDDRIMFFSEDMKHSLAGEPSSDYPVLDVDIPKAASATVKADIIRRALNLTMYAVSGDLNRISLSGVLFEFLPDQTRVVASDGHILSFVKIIGEEIPYFGETVSPLIPSKTLITLLRMLDEEDVQVKTKEGGIVFVVGNYALVSNLISERFPAYEQIIPRESKGELIVDRETFVDALNGVKILENPLTHLVKLAISDGKIEFSASDTQIYGEAYRRLDAEYSGDSICIGFSSEALLKIFKGSDSEKMKLLFNSPKSTVMVQPFPKEEGFDHLALIMPSNIPEE